MSKQRFVKDSFWTDSYIESLTPDEKLIFLYLLTNPLNNVAGMYEVRIKRIGFETGYDVEVIENVLCRFERDSKVLRQGHFLVLVNHIKNQANNPSIIQGCVRIFNELSHDNRQAVTGWVQAGLLNLTLLNLTLPNKTISDKSPIMPFNKNKEEAVVDYDSGDIVEPVKPQTKKYPNAPKVYKVFQAELGKLPANWRINKTQLLSAENLYTERGVPAIENALRYYKENKEAEYIPFISSPFDLDAKWSKLANHKNKQS